MESGGRPAGSAAYFRSSGAETDGLEPANRTNRINRTEPIYRPRPGTTRYSASPYSVHRVLDDTRSRLPVKGWPTDRLVLTATGHRGDHNGHSTDSSRKELGRSSVRSNSPNSAIWPLPVSGPASRQWWRGLTPWVGRHSNEWCNFESGPSFGRALSERPLCGLCALVYSWKIRCLGVPILGMSFGWTIYCLVAVPRITITKGRRNLWTGRKREKVHEKWDRKDMTGGFRYVFFLLMWFSLTSRVARMIFRSDRPLSFLFRTMYQSCIIACWNKIARNAFLLHPSLQRDSFFKLVFSVSWRIQLQGW